MSVLLLAATIGGCGFAGVNPRSPGAAPGQLGYQVVAGDSIQAIAARNATTVEAIAARNNIPPPYQLAVGQRLVIPAPSDYVVQPGETLNDIARRYGMTPAELGRINGIGAPFPVQTGQVLRVTQEGGLASGGVTAGPASGAPVQVSALPLPGVADSAAIGQIVPQSGTGAVATGDPIPLTGGPALSGTVPGTALPTLQPPPLDPAGPALAATEQVIGPALPPATPDLAASSAIPSAAATTTGGLPNLSGSGFLRPVSGSVLSAFGQGSPVPNDGVNIAAPSGTPILAAEAGIVAYVGEDIDNFGHLLLIRHADGWVTAYGHAEAILVGEGDVVTRGQAVGRVGQTGSVTVPQVHFELRRGTEPVDPMAYLDG